MRRHRARTQARRAQGDRLPAGRHPRRARVRRARPDHREVPPRVRPDRAWPARPMAANDLVRSARPILEDLAERTRETVNVGVLSGDAVVYVDQVTGTRSIVSVNWVGQRTPLHCTSNGKVLLAFMREDARDRLLAEPLPRLTPRTITDPERLRRPAHRDPRPRLRPDDGRTRGGPQRGGSADPRDERGRARRAQRVGARPSGCGGVDLPRIGRATAEAAAVVSRRLGYVDRGRPAAG